MKRDDIAGDLTSIHNITEIYKEPRFTNIYNMLNSIYYNHTIIDQNAFDKILACLMGAVIGVPDKGLYDI